MLRLEHLDATTLSILLLSFIICQSIYLFASIPSMPDNLSPLKQKEWGVHCVSFCHSCIISFLALPILFDPVLLADPVRVRSPNYLVVCV